MDEKISIKDFEEIRHYLDPNIFMEPKQYRINGKIKIRNFCVLLLSMIIKRKIKSE